MWPYSGKTILVLALLFLSRQPVEAFHRAGDDSLRQTAGRYFISAGIDLSRPALALIRQGRGGAEAGFDVRTGKHIFGVNAGFAVRRSEFPGYSFLDQGTYLLAGAGKSFFAEPDHVLACGLWAGFSRFVSRPGDIRIPLFPGTATGTPEAPASTQNFAWLEFRGLVRTRLYAWLMLGLDVRLRGRLAASNDELPSYFIPGYGLRKNRVNPAIAYSIFLQVPFTRPRGGKAD